MRKKITVCLCLFLLQNPPVFGGTKFGDLKLPPDIFPVETRYSQIEHMLPQPYQKGFFVFLVHTARSDYNPEGFVALRQVLREVQVIEELDTHGTASGVGEGAAGSLKDTGRGFVNLFVHPVKSVTGIGKAVGKLGGKVGGVFDDKEDEEKVSMGESIVGGEKRKIAKELGVDVYSRNIILQEKLNALAKARVGGAGTVAVLKLLIPVAGVASFVITASGINSAADQLVNDCDRGELYRLNRKALRDIGFGEQTVKDLLANLFYTPRELTYLRFYLETLRTVENFNEIAEGVFRARSEIAARKILYEGQIAADAFRESPAISKLHVIPEGIALEKGDQLVFVVAYDYLDIADFGTQIFHKALDLKKTYGKNGLAIWSGGRISAGFSSLALARGVRTRDMLLFRKK